MSGAITSGGAYSPFLQYTDVGDGQTHWAPSSVFSAQGTVLIANSSEFEVEFTGPGPMQGYSIAFFANEEGFTYDANDHTIAPGGDSSPDNVSSIEVFDAKNHAVDGEDGSAYFTACLPCGGSLNEMWDTLLTSGAKAALDQLIGSGVTESGSGVTDYVETYGQFGVYDLGTGNSFLDITYGNTTAYADGANDTFTIEKGGLVGLSLHGGSQVSDVGSGPVATINFTSSGTLSFNSLDGFSYDHFIFSAASGGQYIYLTVAQLPQAFDVQGSSSGAPNEIVILPQGDVPTSVNLSNVGVANFARFDQAFVFDFHGNTQPNSVVGVQGARNVFELGHGNSSAIGGGQSDIFYAGGGHDFFDGRGGVDVAIFDAARSHFRVTKIAPHEYVVRDLRPHSPDGTVTLLRVEYLSFTNKEIYIGGGATFGATAHAAALAHAAHTSFDLMT